MKKNCKKCGHIWEPRTGKPKSCPACKSYHWERDPVRAQKLADIGPLEPVEPVIRSISDIVQQDAVKAPQRPSIEDLTDEEIEEMFN